MMFSSKNNENNLRNIDIRVHHFIFDNADHYYD